MNAFNFEKTGGVCMASLPRLNEFCLVYTYTSFSPPVSKIYGDV